MRADRIPTEQFHKNMKYIAILKETHSSLMKLSRPWIVSVVAKYFIIICFILYQKDESESLKSDNGIDTVRSVFTAGKLQKTVSREIVENWNS